MKKKFDRNYIYIVLAWFISCIICLGAEYYITNGEMGVPLDDTWIHFQFADNFSNGHFFEYNIGEPTAGTTSPLYVIVLGTAGLITKNFILSSLLISSLFYLFSCLLVYKISMLIFEMAQSQFQNSAVKDFISPGFLSILAALLTVFAGRFAWAGLSGMETTMFTFFCLAGVLSYLKDIQSKRFTLLPTLLFALAATSRPEGFLLYSIYILVMFVNSIKVKTLRSNYFRIFISVFIFLCLTLPYFIFSYKLSGNFLPNTFRGQGGHFDFIPDLTYVRIGIIFFFRDNFFTALLYLFAVLFYFKNTKRFFNDLKYLNMIFLWIILLPAVSSIVIPNWRHHVRYLIPLIPFINIASVYVLELVMRTNFFVKFNKSFLRPKKVGITILAVSFIYYAVYVIALGKNTDNINNQQVKLAAWVNENVPRDATIALNDIGAITFINKNRIIDMAGLVTPEMLQYGKYNIEDRLDSINYLLKKNNVSYIIIYDHWYREFLDKYGNTLTFVTSAYLEENTICGGDEMKVYKTNYNR
ncbi:MAG: hypothetical protein ABI462_03870 [Ignavibacteria bacterium]